MQCENWTTCSTAKWRRSSFKRPTMALQLKSRMGRRCVVQLHRVFFLFIAFYTAQVFVSSVSPLSLLCWPVFSFSFSRSLSRVEVGPGRWTASAAISPSRACPSALAPRAAPSTVWTKRPQTAAASWIWWKETTRSCPTILSYTSNPWVMLPHYWSWFLKLVILLMLLFFFK